MKRPPMEPPVPEELKLLAGAGLLKIGSCVPFRCLRWTTADFRAGVLYASDRALPWGCYFPREDGVIEILWASRPQAVLLVLAVCHKTG